MATKRIEILKTYKLYIGGQFPRTESGRYYSPVNSAGQPLANCCLSSRKDFRDAVVAARTAFAGWASRAAFNRGQILYRIAEMLEGRKAQFQEELILQGSTAPTAAAEIGLAIDRLVYYAGWTDKYQQLFSSVNPVASSHFNFSVPEPTGVVALLAPRQPALLGLVSLIAPQIAGGNTCVALASETHPLCAISFAEVLHSADLPAGVVNILTGKNEELAPHIAGHLDVNALVYAGNDTALYQQMEEKAAQNVKRMINYSRKNWLDANEQSPYEIMDTQEIKTTWHPIENIGSAASKY